MSKSKKKKNKKRNPQQNNKPVNKQNNIQKKSAEIKKKPVEVKKGEKKPEINKTQEVVNKHKVELAKEITHEKTPDKKAEKKTISFDLGKFKKIDKDKLVDKYLSSKDKKEKTIVYSITGAILVFFIVMAILLLCGVFATPESVVATANYRGRNEPETNVVEITASEKDQKRFVKETKSKGATGHFDFYALTECEVLETGSNIPLTLSNPTYNKSVLIFTITDGNGNILYRSLGVKPGECINSVHFNTGLKYGKNNLKMYVAAFEGDGGKSGKSFTNVGIQTVNLTVKVNTENIVPEETTEILVDNSPTPETTVEETTVEA